jgi:hypothetical protein
MSNPFRGKTIALCAFVGIVITTLACAPNYRWQEALADVPYGADFLQEWVAGRMILSGQAGNVYNAEAFQRWQHDPEVIGFEWNDQRYFPPVYPPLHYLLFTPFAWIPYRWAAMLWGAMLWGLVFLNAKWIASIARHDTAVAEAPTSLQRLVSDWGWLAVVLFPVVPISVMFGQKSLFWLAILCWTFRRLQLKQPVRAGLIFALLSLKPTLFFLIPCMMVCRGQWRFVAGCTLGIIGLWGLAGLLLPGTMWQSYCSTLVQATTYGTQGGYRTDWSCNIWSLARIGPSGWQAWIASLLCFPMAAWALLETIRLRCGPLDPRFIFLTLCSTMLIAPHAYHYDVCIILLPIGWMAAIRTRFAIATYGVLAFGLASVSMLYSLVPIPILPLVLWGCAMAWIWDARLSWGRWSQPQPEREYATAIH